jgi:hypothetical protein
MKITDVLLLGPMCASLALGTITNAQTYSDPQGRFRIDIPAGWTVSRINDDGIAFVQGDSYAILMVYESQTDPARAIGQLAEQMRRQWRAVSATSRTETTLADHRALAVSYLGTNPKEVPAYLHIVGASDGGRTFVVVASSPAAQSAYLKGIVTRMEQSFVINQNAALNRPAAQPARTSALAGVETVPAIDLIPTRSPNSDFTVALPRGWSMSASPAGDAVSITPSGRAQPSVSLALVNVSDLRYAAAITRCSAQRFNPFGDLLTQCVIPSVRIELQDSSRPWTPQESIPLIIERLQQANPHGPSFGRPDIYPVSSSHAFYRVSTHGSMGALDTWGSLTMFYMPNPMIGPGRVTSLALIAGCSAPMEQVESFRHTCSGMLRSFRPAAGWGERFAGAMVNGYSQEAQILLRMGQTVVQSFAAREQMISSFGQAMLKMQFDAFEARQAAQLQDGQGEIAALAGDDLVRDPETGALVPVPHGYPSYCFDNSGLTGEVLAGPGLTPGKSVGSYRCQQMVSPGK